MFLGNCVNDTLICSIAANIKPEIFINHKLVMEYFELAISAGYTLLFQVKILRITFLSKAVDRFIKLNIVASFIFHKE